MTKNIWEFDILRCTRVSDLQAMREDVVNDETLTSVEVDELCQLIHVKISRLQLRQRGAGPQ